MPNDPKETADLLLGFRKVPSQKEREQHQSNLKKPNLPRPNHMADFKKINLPSSGPTPPLSPATAENMAKATNSNTILDSKPAIQPIRIILDLRSGKGRPFTTISGVSPTMTGFVLSLMRLSLECCGLDYGAKGVKLYGDHCRGVKRILTTKLGVPGDIITMRTVKA